MEAFVIVSDLLAECRSCEKSFGDAEGEKSN